MIRKLTPLKFEDLHENLIAKQMIMSCFNCEYMDKATELCSVYNVRPPLHVLIYSCREAWMGEIPF